MSGSADIIYKSAQIIAAGDMSANITSTVIDLQGINNIAIHSIYTGSPSSGSLKVQTSCDLVGDGSLVVNWNDESTTAISAAGNTMYKASNLGVRWIRVIYVFTSGTGSLTSNFSGKS